MNYILYGIWQMPFYIYGLVVSAQLIVLCKQHRLTRILGTPRIRFHFSPIIVAGPTFLLRALPASAHSPRHHVLRRIVVSSKELAATVGAAGYSDPVGSRSSRTPCNLDMEELREKTDHGYGGGSSRVSGSGGR